MTTSPSPDRTGLRLVRVCLVLGVLLIAAAIAVAAAGGLGGTSSAAAFRVVPVVNVGTEPVRSAVPEPSADATTPRPGPASLPAKSRLQFPGLGIQASITAVQAPGGVMQVPADPRLLGWWAAGAAPGEHEGTVVIVGHVNFAGVAGALAQLPDARPGEEVSIAQAGQEFHYRVTAVRTYAKSSGIPAAVFSQTAGGGRLVLITCGGPFDPTTGNYLDNIVAYADRT